jgi:DNA-binding transcriptional LysR family regulator
MNLNQLKIFYVAAKRESFIAAANELNVTQPAITKGIQRLQEHYELKFVNRFGKKMVLTDAGEVLFKIAEKIFEMEMQAEESIRDFQVRKRGHIRILASESFGAYYLPDFILPFCKKYPRVRVSCNILPTEQVAENTANLKNDLGFISFPVKNEKLTVREIITDQLVIIVSPGHPFASKKRMAPRDLDGQSVISHEKGSASAKALQHYIRKNSLSVKFPLEFSSNRAVKLAVQKGIGIALISRKIAGYEISTGQLKAIPFSDPSMLHRYYLVCHKDKYFSEMLQNLINAADQWAVEYADSLIQTDPSGLLTSNTET